MKLESPAPATPWAEAPSEMCAAPVEARAAGNLRVWAGVLLLAVIFAFAMIDRVVLSMVIEPVKADLGLSDAAFGVAQGLAIALFYVLCAIPFGWAADRFDRRYVLSFGIAVWSLASASCALAKSFGGLFLSRCLVGAGESALGPSGYPMVAGWAKGRRLPVAMMIFVLGGVAGNAIGQFVGGPLLVLLQKAASAPNGWFGHLAPWRSLFLITGLPGLVLAGLVLLTPRGAEGRAPVARTAEASVGAFSRFLLRHGRFYFGFIGGIGFQQASMFGVILWNSAYVMRVYHWRPDQVGLAFGSLQLVVSLLAAIGHTAAMGALYARGHKDIYPKWQRCMSAIAIPALALAYLGGSTATALAGFALFHAAIGGTLVAGPTALQYATPQRFRGRTSGVYVLIASLLGTAMGPALIGFATDRVFGDEHQVGAAIATCGIAFNLVAALLYTICLPTCRAVLYETENAARSAGEAI